MWIKIRGFSEREKELDLDVEESSGTMWRRDQRGRGRMKNTHPKAFEIVQQVLEARTKAVNMDGGGNKTDI